MWQVAIDPLTRKMIPDRRRLMESRLDARVPLAYRKRRLSITVFSCERGPLPEADAVKDEIVGHVLSCGLVMNDHDLTDFTVQRGDRRYCTITLEDC